MIRYHHVLYKDFAQVHADCAVLPKNHGKKVHVLVIFRLMLAW